MPGPGGIVFNTLELYKFPSTYLLYENVVAVYIHSFNMPN